MNLNLFFLWEGYYKCIVTTQDEIPEIYDRKVSVELESAKPWLKGTLVGPMGSAEVPDIGMYNDENYFYIDARKWLYDDKNYALYMAVPKVVADGKRYITKDLTRTLNNSSCNVFLFPKESVIA